MSAFYVEKQHWVRFPKVLLMKKKTGYGNITRRYVPERTCRIEFSNYDELLDSPYTELSCGHEVHMREERINYCPECGARVVGDAE